MRLGKKTIIQRLNMKLPNMRVGKKTTIQTYHEVAQYEGREKDDHTKFSVGSHAIPKRFDPLST